MIDNNLVLIIFGALNLLGAGAFAYLIAENKTLKEKILVLEREVKIINKRNISMNNLLFGFLYKAKNINYDEHFDKEYTKVVDETLTTLKNIQKEIDEIL